MLQDRFDDLLSAVNAKDWAKLGDFYTDEVVLTGPKGMPLEGKEGNTN